MHDDKSKPFRAKSMMPREMQQSGVPLKKRWLYIAEAEQPTTPPAVPTVLAPESEPEAEPQPRSYPVVRLKMAWRFEGVRFKLRGATSANGAAASREEGGPSDAEARKRKRDAELMPPPPPRERVSTPPSGPVRLERASSVEEGERPSTPPSKRQAIPQPAEPAIARVAAALGLPQEEVISWFKINRQVLLEAVKAYEAERAASGSGAPNCRAQHVVAQCIRSVRAAQISEKS